MGQSLKPRPRLIPTGDTMVPMVLELEPIVDSDTMSAMVTLALCGVTMASVRPKPSPRLIPIGATMAPMELELEPTTEWEWDTMAVLLVTLTWATLLDTSTVKKQQ